MFGFLVRRWAARRRRIFPFNDGTRKRWADPVRVYTLLTDACPDYAALLATVAGASREPLPGAIAASVEADRKAATEKLLSVTRAVFGVEPFTDAGGAIRGLTDAETVALLADYLAYMNGLGELARPT
jgi:hypothetical protein